jgi:hypothetical protein
MCKRIIICLTILISCFICCNNIALAKTRDNKYNRFPGGCEPRGYKFDLYNVIFIPSSQRHSYSQTVYFIHNVSNATVHLLQASNGDKPYIIHVNGSISPKTWSVLSVSEPKIKYICTNYDRYNQDHRVINCQNVLDICEFPYTRFGPNHHGTYWLTLNRSRNSAVRATRFHGILLIDHKLIKNDG